MGSTRRIRLRGFVALALVLGTALLVAPGAGAAGFALAGPPVPTETPFVPGDNCIWQMATADFNNDGNLDIAIGCSAKVAVLLGDGHGGLVQAPGSPYQMDGSGPDSIGVADFNGDGNLDVVVGNGGNGALSTMFGDGTGRLVRAPHSPATTCCPAGMGVTDLNGDQKPDVAVATSSDIQVFLGRGTLGDFDFVEGNTFRRCCQTGLAMGDFNRDGRLDLAVPNIDKTLWVLLGDGQGHFSPASSSPISTGGQPREIVSADFNGDGAPDVAITLGNTDVAVLLGDGHGGMSIAPGSPFTLPVFGPLGIATGDFNGDGRPDLALTFLDRQAADGSFFEANDVWVLLGDGSGGMSVPPGSPITTDGQRPFVIAVGDFDGNGRSDLGVLNSLSRDVSVLLNYKSAEKVCEAQRRSMGDAAFDQRYGGNGNGANSFGKCVSENKGF